MQQQVLSVAQLNEYIKMQMDNDLLLSGLLVRGELSNYKIYPSGHHYFTLKDQEGAMRCVMFKASASKLKFRPENGMKVILADEEQSRIQGKLVELLEKHPADIIQTTPTDMFSNIPSLRSPLYQHNIKKRKLQEKAEFPITEKADLRPAFLLGLTRQF